MKSRPEYVSHAEIPSKTHSSIDQSNNEKNFCSLQNTID